MTAQHMEPQHVEIPPERRPWLVNMDEGYVMPDDAHRCEARYEGKYRCDHWRTTPHKLHWTWGGNLEWESSQ